MKAHITEIKKVHFIKIVLCLLLLFRVYQIANTYFYFRTEVYYEDVIFIGIYTLAIIFTLLSKKWYYPLIIAALHYKFNDYFFSKNVGQAIVCYLCYAIAFLQYWQYKNVSEEELGKRWNHFIFLLILVWSFLNFTSAIVHIREDVWLSGEAIGTIGLNPYLCRFYEFFQNLYLNHNLWFNVFTLVITYLFLFMQFTQFVFFYFKQVRIIFYIWIVMFNLGLTFYIDAAFLSYYMWLFLLLILPPFIIDGRKIILMKNEKYFYREYKLMNITASIILLFFSLIHFPIINRGFDKVVWFFREWDSKKYISNKLTMFGIAEPNVFNSYQIKRRPAWFCIYHCDTNDNYKLLPFVDENGRKMSFSSKWLNLTNHGSEFLFYGNLFQYNIGVDTFSYINSVTPNKLKGRVSERLMNFYNNKYLDGKDSSKFLVKYFSYSQNGDFLEQLDSSIKYQFVNGKLITIK